MLIAIVMLGVGLGGGYWIERWRRAQVPAVPTPNVVTRDDKAYFGAVPCSTDCLTARAGFFWARKHDIDNEPACRRGESSAEFRRACLLYVNQRWEAEPDPPL
jgi:hypothetical protein